MRSFVRPLVSISMILAFASCSDVTAPRTVDEAQMLWQSKNIQAYSYVADIACFCSLTGPVKVEVAGGHVARVTVIATGAQVTGYSTIDEFFDQIRSATPALTVEFDRVLGYPTRIERCCLADDSGSVTTISSLVPSS